MNVTPRDAANVGLEPRAAVCGDGLWRCTATTAVPAGAAVTITATATDSPGNPGSLSAPLAVA